MVTSNTKTINISYYTLNNLKNRFYNGNSIAALMFGMAVVLIKSILYLNYSDNHTVNIFEGFMFNYLSIPDTMFMMIPSLLLFIDAPFIDDYSYMAVYRMKRKNWFYSNYIYIIIKTFLYNFILLVTSFIPLLFKGYFENQWSQTFLKMMNGYSAKMDKYHLASPIKELKMFTPLKAVLITIILFSLYIILLSEILFAINMVCKRKYLGTFVVGGMYIIISIIDGQAFMLPDSIRKVLITRNVFFAMYYNPKISNYFFSILYLILLNYIVYIFASTLFPFADFEESNNEN